MEENPSERAERLERIRREIAEGKYDTEEKMEKALQNFLRCEELE